MASFAKAEILVKDLKDRLKLRAFAPKDEKTSAGWPRLVDASATPLWSVEVEAVDMVSKDVLGQDLKAYKPHLVRVAVVTSMAEDDKAKFLLEVFKMGVDEIEFKSGVDLATAEAATPTVFHWDVLDAGKGV